MKQYILGTYTIMVIIMSQTNVFFLWFEGVNCRINKQKTFIVR